MGLMEVASGKSVYRGYEYYIHNKVLFAEKVDEYQYRGAVEGTADEPYEVLIDGIHPRKSHCNCPHADGWRDLSRYADYTISLTADEEMLRRRLIRRKMKTGMTREDAERFVESSDMRNVRLCLDKTMKADLELSI